MNGGEAVRNFNKRLIHSALAGLEGGDIAIVWDHSIIKKFDVLISAVDLARKCRVTKNFSLDGKYVIPDSVCHVAYFIVPTNSSVTELIKYFPRQQQNSKVKYHVFFVPDANYILKERLKACAGIWEQISDNIHVIPCHWYPDDQVNFLHMALTDLPARMQLDGDWNYLYKCATALMQFRRQFLTSMREENRSIDVYCDGKWSERIVEMMRKVGDQNNGQTVSSSNVIGDSKTCSLTDIDTIVIVDRWMDLVTPMLIPFTLGGAIDDLFDIDFQGKTKMTVNMLEDDGEAEEQTNSAKPKYVLLSGDVHERLHDLHIHELSNDIRDLVMEIKEEEKNREKLKSIADYKDFVSERMPQLMQRRSWTDRFLKIAGLIQRRYAENFFSDVINCQQEILHNSLLNGTGGDKVLPFIETAMAEAREPHIVLRLVALQSLIAARGLRPQVLSSYRKSFVQSYGIFALKWWLKLQVAGLIREDTADNRSCHEMYLAINYSLMAKKYRLLCSEFKENKNVDSSYAFNGCASLLVRRLEEGLNGNWREFKKVENFFDGTKSSSENMPNPPNTEDVSRSQYESIVPASIAASFSALGLSSSADSRAKKSERRIMLFVVGGITRAEAGALRHLYPDNIRLCATTATITAKSLLESFK